MPRLLSVNVGLPRNVAWNGKTVRTAIWKSPVTGRRMVRKLDIDGDAQGDLAGTVGSRGQSLFIKWTPITTGNAFWGVMTSSTDSSEKTSRLTNFSMMKSALAIATALVVLYLKYRSHASRATASAFA